MLLAHLLIRQPQSCFPKSELLHPGCQGSIINLHSSESRLPSPRENYCIKNVKGAQVSTVAEQIAKAQLGTQQPKQPKFCVTAWLHKNTLKTRGQQILSHPEVQGPKEHPHDKTANAGWHHHRPIFKVRKSKCNTRVTLTRLLTSARHHWKVTSTKRTSLSQHQPTKYSNNWDAIEPLA